MRNNAVNQEELSAQALILRGMLEKYAPDHQAAKDVLERNTRLIEDAINKRVTLPITKGFFPEELWEDGGLFQLVDLRDAAARFSILLEGWESLDHFRRSIRDAESRADQDRSELHRKLNVRRSSND